MAKKKFEGIEAATPEVQAQFELDVMEEELDSVVKKLAHALEQVSLRQIALSTGCTYNVLLKASKAPIEGQMYDPEVPNLRAVVKAMKRKLGEDLTQLNWDEVVKDILENAPVREVGGVSIDSFEIDDYVKLRDIKDADGNVIPQPVYQLKIRTGTHVVLVPVTEGYVPRVISYETFIHQGARKYDFAEAEAVVQKVAAEGDNEDV